jgi:hypothetical protein
MNGWCTVLICLQTEDGGSMCLQNTDNILDYIVSQPSNITCCENLRSLILFDHQHVKTDMDIIYYRILNTFLMFRKIYLHPEMEFFGCYRANRVVMDNGQCLFWGFSVALEHDGQHTVLCRGGICVYVSTEINSVKMGYLSHCHSIILIETWTGITLL